MLQKASFFAGQKMDETVVFQYNGELFKEKGKFGMIAKKVGVGDVLLIDNAARSPRLQALRVEEITHTESVGDKYINHAKNMKDASYFMTKSSWIEASELLEMSDELCQMYTDSDSNGISKTELGIRLGLVGLNKSN